MENAPLGGDTYRRYTHDLWKAIEVTAREASRIAGPYGLKPDLRSIVIGQAISAMHEDLRTRP